MLRIDLNLVWTIINVIILYLLLKKFLIKPVTAIMDKREQMVKQGLEGARAQESQAKELKVKYEEALASAKEESLQLVEKARGNAQVEYDRILGEADEQAKKIKEAARKDVELDREKAMKEMQSEVAGLALTAVSRILQEVIPTIRKRAPSGCHISVRVKPVTLSADIHPFSGCTGASRSLDIIPSCLILIPALFPARRGSGGSIRRRRLGT